MQKAADFLENRKDVLFGMLAVLATGILGYRVYQDYRNQRQRDQRESTIENRKRLIPKGELLAIMAAIRAESREELRPLRENFRAERRKVFEDQDAYQRVVDDFNKKLQSVIETTNQKVFKKFKTDGKNFDESVQALNNDDEVLMALSNLSSLAKLDTESAPPDNINKQLLLEILIYNNKRYNEIAFETPRRSYDYLLTRIQDEIYFKYNIEVEDLNSCYNQFNLEEDQDLREQILTMQLSTSKLFSS